MVGSEWSMRDKGQLVRIAVIKEDVGIKLIHLFIINMIGVWNYLNSVVSPMLIFFTSKQYVLLKTNIRRISNGGPVPPIPL